MQFLSGGSYYTHGAIFKGGPLDGKEMTYTIKAYNASPPLAINMPEDIDADSSVILKYVLSENTVGHLSGPREYDYAGEA